MDNVRGQIVLKCLIMTGYVSLGYRLRELVANSRPTSEVRA